MHKGNVTLTDDQVQQAFNVHAGIWEVLKQADGLPTETVIKILTLIVTEILEQAGVAHMEVIDIPASTTLQ